jgi:hypothetical protein
MAGAAAARRRPYRDRGEPRRFGRLAALLQLLLPLRRGEPNRMLFVPTAGEWAAYFDNLATGPDVLPIIRHLAIALNCPAVRLTAVPHTRRGTCAAATGRYGATVLEIIDPIHGRPPLRYLRSIAAVNDGGRWRFDAVGPQQPFEAAEHYRSKLVRDRFPVTLLRDYLRTLGLDAFEPSSRNSIRPASPPPW